jgi:hypothetical protein
MDDKMEGQRAADGLSICKTQSMEESCSHWCHATAKQACRLFQLLHIHLTNMNFLPH